ncbi:MAG: deoxyribose-phosphate aldolase [Merdibacter sp.]|nr:deoxyribose-phosphate aldolase [Merdibacter sp.]
MERNKYIDHTLLKADATRKDIEKLCAEAKQYDFASVCVNTYWVPLCASELKDSDVSVCCVVGFPLGAMSTQAKAFETRQAVKDGADEIDMVINIGELKNGNDEAVLHDIEAVVQAAEGAVVKVILENCLLEKEEIVRACKLCMEAKADFVKTSTGFSTGGAVLEDVRLMKETVVGKCKVKAAGGIRSKADMDAMIEAGADRIGTSAGISLL